MASNITRWSICLLVLLSIVPSVFGLYFYLEGSESKCFTEELPAETTVAGHYIAEKWHEDTQKFALDKDITIEIFVEEMPAANRVFNQKLGSDGKFKFTSAESGEHSICLSTTNSGWFSAPKIRLTFDMEVTDSLEDALETAESGFSEMAQRIRELNHKVGEIRREQAYLRDHEQEFRNKSEATNGHTVTWTIVQLIVLGITCAWQMRHLRGFFEARKMI
ncbi:emp24p/erv25p- protein [Dissophora globulifera]|nr:emp24p/erv25p- protein [Dissophora globulifera]